MTELTLIRHGQAQTGAKDEISYDDLSNLGHEQARCLGAYFQQSKKFDKIVSGTMKRQIQTAKSLSLVDIPYHTDSRLNEFDYFGLSNNLQNTHGVSLPLKGQSFETHVSMVLDIWRKGNISPEIETYEAFCTRIIGALTDVTQHQNRVLLVTSTGVIATLAALALGLDTNMKSKLFLSIAHTSIHKFELRGDELHLTQFGATPHLDRHDLTHSKTYA